jgi:hypothetical protein
MHYLYLYLGRMYVYPLVDPDLIIASTGGQASRPRISMDYIPIELPATH